MEIFVYKNQDSLRYVFICKKQDTLCHVNGIFVLIYKDQDTLCYVFKIQISGQIALRSRKFF